MSKEMKLDKQHDEQRELAERFMNDRVRNAYFSQMTEIHALAQNRILIKDGELNIEMKEPWDDIYKDVIRQLNEYEQQAYPSLKLIRHE